MGEVGIKNKYYIHPGALLLPRQYNIAILVVM